MRNAGLDEAQAGIKIARRNINNFRYADDTTLMAKSEELKSLLKAKEESEKFVLKCNIQKTKIKASGPITSWQMNREVMETVKDLIFLGSKITADGDYSHEIKRCLLLGRKAITNLDGILKSRNITLPTKVYVVKGNQSWIFIENIDAEAETSTIWPPDAKSWLIGKDPNAGKDWKREEKGMTEEEMVGWHHQLNGHEFE